MVDFGSDGIYLNQAYEGTAPGLWRLDLRTGQLTQILGSDRVVDAIQGSAAWVTDIDPAARAATSQEAGGPVPNRLSRLDLKTGILTHWFTFPDALPEVIGYDVNGNPVVAAVGQTGTDVWLTRSPGQATRIASYAGVGLTPPLRDSAIGDSHGVWIGAPDGVYLYGPDGYRRIAATAHWAAIGSSCV